MSYDENPLERKIMPVCDIIAFAATLTGICVFALVANLLMTIAGKE